MKTREREKESRDSIALMLLILLLGFICIILSSGWALRFALSWRLPANMGSNLNPDSDFLTGRPVNLLEPLDPAILTDPAWNDVFLTPGASFATRVAATPTQTPMTVRTAPLTTDTPASTVLVPVTNTLVTIPTNTQIYIPPPSATPKPKPTREPPTDTPVPPPTATDTPVIPAGVADLQITKDDGATDYEDGGFTIYTIVVTNNGPNDVIGAAVLDTKPNNISFWSWACTSETSGLGTCTPASASSLNFTDTINLPVGASITYMVPATILSGLPGPLTNTVTVNVPAGYTDPTPGNNSATDTDQLIVPNAPGNIGTTPDGVPENIPPGTYRILQFGTPLVVGSGQNLVYYLPPTLEIDAVILQLSDGSNWYTVFNWGNGSADGNTDVSVPLPVPPNPTDCAVEPDQCVVDSSLLVNSPGITINVNALPAGDYPYIRIISPPNPPDTNNNGVNVDAIAILP